MISKAQRLEIEGLVGAPFETGGRGPAFDCLGLTLAGLAILRPDLTIGDPWLELGARWAEGWRPGPGDYFPSTFLHVELDQVRAGDVLLVGHHHGELPTMTHVDLALWSQLVLRTRKRTGATIDNLRRLRSGPKARTLLGAMRPPGELPW